MYASRFDTRGAFHDFRRLRRLLFPQMANVKGFMDLRIVPVAHSFCVGCPEGIRTLRSRSESTGGRRSYPVPLPGDRLFITILVGNLALAFYLELGIFCFRNGNYA